MLYNDEPAAKGESELVDGILQVRQISLSIVVITACDREGESSIISKK